MLISKSSIARGEIVSFKLVNGDEIVARIAEITDTGYLLSRPCLVMPSQQGIGLIQALFSADPSRDIEVSKQHVMMAAPTIDQLHSHYIKTTTGIVT